ncbi:MAG: dihydrolipoamide acetyltransferase family protein [Chloroflexota bacterium]
MPIQFIMPKFDMDQETATVASWYKADGEQVELDEPVLSVETDKVAIDVPAPATGKLVRITAQVGDIVPVTTVIAYILEKGDTEADLPPAEAPKEQQVDIQPAKPAAAKPGAAVSATPVAMRMAQEHGVDLADVNPDGSKVTKADVENYLSRLATVSTGRVQVRATPAARRIAGEKGINLTEVPGSGPRGRVQADDVLQFNPALQPASVKSADRRQAKLVPLVGMRKTIAQKMQVSSQTIPHINISVDVEVSGMLAKRSKINEANLREGEDKVSVTAILVRVVAWALERNQFINASLIDESIHLWRDVNIGVAAAIEEGLIVPVIHHANQRSLSEINADIQLLAERARTGQLSLQDVQGGTFTISNLGMFGVKNFTAIVNPPQSAILAVGKVRKEFIPGIDDRPEVADLMNLTISADHRIVDGAVAAKFLADIERGLENLDMILF